MIMMENASKWMYLIGFLLYKYKIRKVTDHSSFILNFRRKVMNVVSIGPECG